MFIGGEVDLIIRVFIKLNLNTVFSKTNSWIQITDRLVVIRGAGSGGK